MKDDLQFRLTAKLIELGWTRLEWAVSKMVGVCRLPSRLAARLFGRAPKVEATSKVVSADELPDELKAKMAALLAKRKQS
jgi:hypothetical protein